MNEDIRETVRRRGVENSSRTISRNRDKRASLIPLPVIEVIYIQIEQMNVLINSKYEE